MTQDKNPPRQGAAGDKSADKSAGKNTGKTTRFFPKAEGDPKGPLKARAPVAEGLSARMAAFDVLKAVVINGAQLDHALERVFDAGKGANAGGHSGGGLSDQDRRFVHHLVMNVLRHYGRLDEACIALTDKKKAIKPPELRLIALLAMTQIWLMEVPDYAAVDTALRLAIKKGLARQKGFLNALLRRATCEDGVKAFQAASLSGHYPAWLAKLWRTDYGKDAADAIMNGSVSEPDLDLTCRDAAMRDVYAQKLDALPVGFAGLRLPKAADRPPITDLEGYEEGDWWVQDAASAAPVALMAARIGDLSGKRILDVCAAPGGKTLQLAVAGADVTALDISAGRMRRVEENADRIGVQNRVNVVVADVLTYECDKPFDVVVLDAPCTATGTLRRNPDVLLHKALGQMHELVALQSRMLTHVASSVAVGGYLLYCTCSLQKQEGEKQIDLFLERNASFSAERFDFSDKFAALGDEGVDELSRPVIDSSGYFRALPAAYPLRGDGFFAALLKKNKE